MIALPGFWQVFKSATLSLINVPKNLYQLHVTALFVARPHSTQRFISINYAILEARHASLILRVIHHSLKNERKATDHLSGSIYCSKYGTYGVRKKVGKLAPCFIYPLERNLPSHTGLKSDYFQSNFPASEYDLKFFEK